MRTKVLLTAPSFGGYGGVQAVALAIAAALPPDEFEARVCFKLVSGCRVDPSFAGAVLESGVPVRIVASGSVELLRQLAWADLVHAHEPSPDIAMAARLLRKPLAITVHQHRKSRNWRRNAKSRVALGLAQERWFISDFVMGTWGAAGMRRARKVPNASVLPSGTMPDTQRRGFVFVSRWVERKGLEELIEAYAALGVDPARWPLTLIGDGPLAPRVLEALSRHGLMDTVRRPGFVDQATRDDALRKARWLVVPPTIGEDFGLTAIEARAVGVPCIATRDGGLQEAAGRHALYCEPGDVQDLTKQLRRAIDMPQDEYRRISAATQSELTDELRPLSDHAALYSAMFDAKAGGRGQLRR